MEHALLIKRNYKQFPYLIQRLVFIPYGRAPLSLHSSIEIVTIENTLLANIIAIKQVSLHFMHVKYKDH